MKNYCNRFGIRKSHPQALILPDLIRSPFFASPVHLVLASPLLCSICARILFRTKTVTRWSEDEASDLKISRRHTMRWGGFDFVALRWLETMKVIPTDYPKTWLQGNDQWLWEYLQWEIRRKHEKLVATRMMKGSATHDKNRTGLGGLSPWFLVLFPNNSLEIYPGFLIVDQLASCTSRKTYIFLTETGSLRDLKVTQLRRWIWKTKFQISILDSDLMYP